VWHRSFAAAPGPAARLAPHFGDLEGRHDWCRKEIVEGLEPTQGAEDANEGVETRILPRLGAGHGSSAETGIPGDFVERPVLLEAVALQPATDFLRDFIGCIKDSYMIHKVTNLALTDRI
jgi:hypothetical protein